MDLLAFREHSVQELINKLTRRFHKRQTQNSQSSDKFFHRNKVSSDFILEQINFLTEENLQSDQRFAESFVRSRINKGQGPLRIKNELLVRGVANHLVAAVLENTATDWNSIIAELSSRKYGDSKPEDEKEKAKRIRFFQYRGFSYEHIKSLAD